MYRKQLGRHKTCDGKKKEEGRGNVEITEIFYTNSRATHKKRSGI